MEDILTTIEWVKQVWEKVPPELKAAAPHVPMCIYNITNTITEYTKKIRPLLKLYELLKNDVRLDPDTAKSIVDECGEFIGPDKEHVTQVLKTPLKIDPNVIQTLEGHLEKLISPLLWNSALASGLCLIMETIQLWYFWKQIKEARNICAESVATRTRISAIFDSVLAEIAKLDQFMIDMPDREVREIAMIEVTEQNDQIRDILHQAHIEIQSLKFKVQNAEMLLGKSRRDGVLSAAVCGVQVTSTIVNLTLLASMANPYLVVFNAVIAAGNVAVAAVNVGFAITTAEDMKRLQDELEEIGKLDYIRAALVQRFNDSVKEVRAHLKAQAMAHRS
ncbi:unnamed protein product [Oppiella nova]|uniref:Uncharacterized protein n=1 Tax=Oppiella nova TaxID=334625 RepID=A0A7R9MI23_9ACAR|nr:unnamed protein product [Oppiella nova]CAG2176776.1 unnamed protein product [Oppiella nova]